MVALDQRLPGGLVLSGSLIHNNALKQVFIENDNLEENRIVGEADDGYSLGFGLRHRQVFGTPTQGHFRGNQVLWQGGRRTDRFGPVLRVTNRGDNFTYAATVELRKDFGETLGLRVGYSLTRSADLQNLTSIDITSNFASTPVNVHPTSRCGSRRGSTGRRNGSPVLTPASSPNSGGRRSACCTWDSRGCPTRMCTWAT